MCPDPKNLPLSYVLDSKNRFTGTNAKPSFNLQHALSGYSQFTIKSIEVPYSFYNITSNNNVLNWTSNTPTATVSTIPIGNYNITDLLTEIATQMNADTDDGNTYTATRSTLTNKITIASSATFELNFDLSINLAKLLGFYPSDSSSTIQPFNSVVELTAASTYTASNSYYISPRYINLHSSLTRDTDFYSKYSTTSLISTEGRTNILQKISLNENGFGEQIVFRPFEEYKYHLRSTQNIQDITFELTDEYLNTIDLNGRSFSIEIIFE